MSKMRWFWVVMVTQGHWKQHHSIERMRVPVSVPFHSNYVAILHRLWYIARYWSKIADFNPTHLFGALVAGDPVRIFRQNLLQQVTRIPGLPYGIVCMILSFGLACLVQYRRVTDGHKTTAYCASVASRDKNTKFRIFVEKSRISGKK